MGQESPLRQVHRTELRSVPESRTEDDEVQGVSTEVVDMPEPEGDQGLDIDHADSSVNNDQGLSDIQHLPGKDPTKETGTTLVFEPRRSARKTAGHHSNPHRLPQSVSVPKVAM